MNVIDNIDDENIKFYLEYLKYERRLSENTVESYGENLKMLITTLKKDIMSLNIGDIRKFLNDVEATSKTKAHYLSVFNSFYNYMIFNERLVKYPCSGIRTPKREKKLPN